VKGEGWLSSVLSKIPAELHIRGYNFCGPNTKLEKRLARGDKGINPLDEACLEHDKIYASTSNKETISEADKVLSEKAWQRFKNKETPLKEKLAAMIVTGAMKAKRKVGGSKTSTKINRGGATLAKTIREARKAVRSSNSKNIKEVSKLALKAAKRVAPKTKIAAKISRILPIPKRGGVLPFLVPLFAGLSAAGGLAGGAAAITKAVIDTNTARKSLEEQKRHNRKMEAVAIKPRGSGFWLKPYKNGYGLMTKSKN